MGQDSSDYQGHFANYAEYSKTFRAWMVAYGIGGPVLFLLNKDAPQAIAASPNVAWIVGLFLTGVVLQILLALLNKWAAWHMYRGALAMHLDQQGDTECDYHNLSKSYRRWRFINKQSWIDYGVDLVSVMAFSIATWLVLSILLTAPKGQKENVSAHPECQMTPSTDTRRSFSLRLDSSATSAEVSSSGSKGRQH
ncbi:hypothetical protein [Pseudoxanthomonas sp. CF125]|uniref:hypothetical protein n=1 Tax=Pseudoxanthomonas sp. CF125 TaxID=1855303 RepID=UPI0008924880|nr:hypothetical protein [Pseudoxanthomonas sp. CF125]SDR10819.1 hypothetical protein SAMN05216569_3132 [Pseudoxanthomonas sp. CF125]